MNAIQSTPPNTHGFDSPEQELYLSIWRTYDRLRVLEDELFARWELTAQQYNVLRLLMAAHPRSVPTISLMNRLVSRSPDITRMLDRLQKRGLIERVRSDADRRSIHVTITPLGVDLVAEIAAPLQACHQQQLGHMTVEEIETLVALLAKARGPHENETSYWK
ncbi:MAG: MarR family transcriptional regulator [Zavarzinella sp.]